MIFSSLDKKLLRDLDRSRGQAVAIGLVIACGIAVFVMSLTTMQTLQRSKDIYFERYRFADVFAVMKRAPEQLKERVGEIPGVGRVQTRVIQPVTLDIEGMSEPARGRLISVPEDGRPVLNNLHLRSGRYIEPGRAGEVIVTEAFAEAHAFEPGDHLSAVLNGSREDLHIVGIALSPEYVVQMPEGEILPDDKRFGVFWMGAEQMEAAFDMESAFNDLTLQLLPGALEEEVIRQLDNLIERYGGAGAVGRDLQMSNRFLEEEIKQLQTMAIITPVIFLGVAAFILNVVMKRMIALEREQIAVMKAFGYSNEAVGLHYLKYVSVIALGGSVGGILFGLWTAQGMTDMYISFYRFPVVDFRLEPSVLLGGCFISVIAAASGVISAVREAVRLPPAEAMRPEPPAIYRKTLMERLGLKRLFSQEARMIIRELERKPLKSVFATLGISMAVAILIVGNYSEDALIWLQDFQYRLTERQDLTVTFIEPRGADAEYGLTSIRGVIHAEPFRNVPARLRAGQFSREVSITGLQPDPQLFRLIDAQEDNIPMPDQGVLMSAKLAEILQVTAGDVLTVEVLEGKRPTRQLTISALVDDYAGTSAYMQLDSLNAFMREGPTISGAYLKVDPQQTDHIYHELKETPLVAGVTIKTAAMESFYENYAKNLLQMKIFNAAFAAAIAIGVVYNSARISLSERSRDLGTLRVIGFTRREISVILLGELAIITAAALPVGMLIGSGLVWSMAQGMQTDLFRLPYIIYPDTYAFAVVVVVIASAASGLLVRRKLDKLNLVDVLKSRF